MAGDWMKIELSLPQKPEVIRIGRILGIPSEAVCGWLIKFWGWVGANSVDGVVDGVVAADVDMVMALPGFSDALVSVGWLKFQVDGKCLTVPNFERHNGETAKKRALKSSRQARWRGATKDAPVDAVVDAPVVQKVPLEKRREDIKPSEPNGSLEAVWDEGIALLTSKGLADSTARSFVGMLCKRHEAADVADAFQSAAGKVDPKGYITAILKTKPLKGAPASRATFD